MVVSWRAAPAMPERVSLFVDAAVEPTKDRDPSHTKRLKDFTAAPPHNIETPLFKT
jgi:hypothetical protein